MPVFGEKTAMKVAVRETCGVRRPAGKSRVPCQRHKSHTGDLITSHQKILRHNSEFNIQNANFTQSEVKFFSHFFKKSK